MRRNMEKYIESGKEKLFKHSRFGLFWDESDREFEKFNDDCMKNDGLIFGAFQEAVYRMFAFGVEAGYRMAQAESRASEKETKAKEKEISPLVVS